MKISIRFKLMCFAFLIVLLVGGTISSYSIQKGRERILKNYQKKCLDITSLISQVVVDHLYSLDIRSLRLRLKNVREKPDIFYTIVLDSEGRIVSDGIRGNTGRDTFPHDPFRLKMLKASTWVSEISGEILIIGGPISMPDGTTIGFLKVGFSLIDIIETVRNNTLSTLYISLICLGLGGVMALLLARNFSKPIIELVRASKALAGGDLPVQLSIKRGDELGLLAESFNQMSRELHQRIASEKERIREMARSNERLKNEVLERKRIMIALQESEQRYRHIFENSPVSLWEEDFSELRQYIKTLDFKNIRDFNDYLDANPLEIRRCMGMIHVIDVNKKTLELFEAENKEQLFVHLEELIPEEAYESMKQEILSVAADEMFEIEILNRTLTRKKLHVQITSSIINAPNAWERVIISMQDMTERIQAEQEKMRLRHQMEHTRKMEAITTLAGGIAHEFNNALAVISGNTELLEIKMSAGKDPKRYFKTILESCDRLAALTNQLLAFAQEGAFHPKAVVFNDFICETIRLLSHSETDITIETIFSDFDGSVKIDTARFQMVLSAILSNASEACSENGLIRVETLTTVVDDTSSLNTRLTPGTYATLAVADNGKGMDKKTLQRIFDPFFTTKFHGRGLGMAAVFGIVKNHKGHITVESQPDVGTTVRVYLPQTAEPKHQPKPRRLPDEPAGGSRHSVLLVEDEEMVMEISRAILEILNYRVFEARTGRETEEFLLQRGHLIDIVILDMKLPDMDGEQVYNRIREIRPEMKVLICSGYSIDGPAQKLLQAGAKGFIQKPFSVELISSRLKEILGAS